MNSVVKLAVSPRTVIILVILGLMLASCATLGPVRDEPGPALQPFTVETLRAMRAFEGVESISSEVRVKLYKGRRLLGTFSGAMAYRPPDSLRLRLYDPFGVTIADIVRVVGRTEVYMPAEGRVYVVWTPSLAPPEDAEYLVGMKRGYAFLEAYAPRDQVVLYNFNPRSGENVSIETLVGGKREVGLRLGDYASGIPLKMDFHMPGRIEMRIKLIEPDTTREVSDRLFHPFDKEGLEVLPLDSLRLSTHLTCGFRRHRDCNTRMTVPEAVSSDYCVP